MVYFSLLEVKISIIALILLLHSFKMVHTAYPPFVPSYLIITVCSILLNLLHFNPTHSLPPYFEKGPFRVFNSNGVYFEEKTLAAFFLLHYFSIFLFGRLLVTHELLQRFQQTLISACAYDQISHRPPSLSISILVYYQHH